jgi:hypothetical protein
MDSFPWDEQGALHNHILQNSMLVENGTAVTTSNITPFIQSLAANTISWETVFSLCTLSNKAMIGCNILFFFGFNGSLLWTTSASD